jgi:carbonic anhydrase
MLKLVKGIHQFRSQVFGSQRELFERLAHGQRPETLFITCSDSRVNPNLITQTGPGDLFIMRNAGNIIPPYGAGLGGEAATIEYAVSVLGVTDVIVCGHSHCGAMDALLHPEQVAKLPAVQQFLVHAETTRRIIREKYQHLSGQELQRATVKENVLVQLEQLRTHPAVAARLAEGQLHLHGWVYRIETGEVVAYSADEGDFVPMTEAPPGPPPRGGMGI